MEVEDFFAGDDEAFRRFLDVRAAVERIGPADVRVTRSQVAFRRRRGFAYVWLPGRWLRHPPVHTVLSVALPERLDSPRVREAVPVTRTLWMHHVPIDAPGAVDGEVEAWLRRAYLAAG